jgi:hypothetical protein
LLTRARSADDFLIIAPGEQRFYVAAGIDGTDKLIGGAWLQSVAATGCGSRRQLNVLMSAQHDGTLGRIALLPGTTIRPCSRRISHMQWLARWA